jgi:hypothetical protein
MRNMLSKSEYLTLVDKISPYLSDVACRDGVLTNEGIKEALDTARENGIKVPRIRSERSFDIIDSLHRGDGYPGRKYEGKTFT